MAVKQKVLLLLVICVLAVGGGCKRRAKQAQQAPVKPVALLTVQTGVWADPVSSSGNIKPTKTVKIAFKIPGTITYLNLEEGDYVRKGQLLAELDARQYALNALAAESNYTSAKLQADSQVPSGVNQAKSQLDLVTSRYERYKSLYESGALPRDKFEEIETELTVVKNKYQEALDAQAITAKKLDQAKAMSDLAQVNLRDAKVYAPISGVVVKKLAEAGELTSPGYPVLVLGELSQVDVEIGVADEYVNRLKIGQTAQIYVYGIEKKVTGRITEIGAMADAETRTFPVKLTLNNQNGQLKPGMIAKVDLSLDPRDAAAMILLPVDSVINQPAGPIVFVYSPKSGAVTQRRVSAGKLFGDQIEITGGLRPGERIVVKGLFQLKDGDRVKAEVR